MDLKGENGEPKHLKLQSNIVNPYKTEPLPLPAIGEKIGPNKIMALVGEGSSAVVYKVWHEGLEVVRAVKLLKNYNSKEARERFFTEAKILADIHHPNIIEVHNIGFVNQQIPFIEMEYVDGMSVRTLLTNSHRLPVEVALSIAYFICLALHYAHTKDYTLYGKVYRGLIHRDIKPDNIFVSKDGIVKLMDFGIARPTEVSLHTVGAKIMGTLVYLSPEQLNGAHLDHRSDIFSLGAVLYEMVSGKRAFPQKTLAEIVQKKSKGEYIPFSHYNLPIPPELSEIIDKSMALNPEDRYCNAADFGNEIFKCLCSITNLSPHTIMQKYLTDPSSINSTTMNLHKRVTKEDKLAYVKIGAIGIVVAIVILLLIKMLF